MFVAAIPIEGDAVVWARLRMRVWPSRETTGIMDSTAQELDLHNFYRVIYCVLDLMKMTS